VEIEIDFGGSELFHFFSNTATTMTDKLILALDVDRADEALALVRLLKPYLSLFKVGNQLFTREGAGLREGVAETRRRHFSRPEMARYSADRCARREVGGGARRALRHGACQRRARNVAAAQEAVKGSRTEILAVTVLTSLDDGALRQIGFDRTAAEQVVRLARLATLAGVSD